jgi:hypothetical protein
VSAIPITATRPVTPRHLSLFDERNLNRTIAPPRQKTQRLSAMFHQHAGAKTRIGAKASAACRTFATRRNAFQPAADLTRVTSLKRSGSNVGAQTTGLNDRP